MTLKIFIAFLCMFGFPSENNAEFSVEFDLFNSNESYAAYASSATYTANFVGYLNASEDYSEFLPDLFSEYQLKHGAIILHFIGAIYSFATIGIICGDYFLPAVDYICCDLNLSQDVAAATFMSFATTAPELFVILIATFLTKSDVGIGAVVGSGMFNILGVATVGGLAAAPPIKLDWWPLFRDSLVYVGAVIGLAVVVTDGVVTLRESLFLIAYYFFYFIIMLFNRRLRKKMKSVTGRIKKKKQDEASSEKAAASIPTISVTLDDGKHNDHFPAHAVNIHKGDAEGGDDESDYKAYFVNYEESISIRRISASSRGSSLSFRRKSGSLRDERRPSDSHLKRYPKQIVLGDSLHIPSKLKEIPENVCKNGETLSEDDSDTQNFRSLFCILPDGSVWTKFTWLCLWPISFIFYWTIPDCRLKNWQKYYPVTFVMCVFWIGSCSYFGTWMISRIGGTIGIPDSVMGLTFLAIGGSMPEAISTYIMARQGEGGLGFSNSLGGNTMDICLCLGVPWLIMCLSEGPVRIYSEGIQYNTLALLVGIGILLLVGLYNKFHMNRTMGFVCCLFYFIFLVVSVLVEFKIIQIAVVS